MRFECFRLKRILVIKLSDIGDVLTATPALRALRETFPAARIDILMPPRSAVVLQNSLLVDEAIVFDKFEYDRARDALAPSALRDALSFMRQLRARRYDTLVLLHHLSTRWGALKWAALTLAVGAETRAGLDNGRGWFLTHRVHDDGFGARHEVEHCMAVVKAVGAETGDWRLEIRISETDRNVATQLLQSKITPERDSRCGTVPFAESANGEDQQSTIVVLHPGSGGHSLARRWSLDRWRALGCALHEKCNAQLVIVGTSSDGGDELARQLPSALNLTGKTTLMQLAAVLQQCDLFIGADSGVMHIAAAVGTPLVALFGTTNAKAWGPWPPSEVERGKWKVESDSGQHGRCVIVQSEVPGCPCSYVRFQIRSDECEARECMNGISVERVVAAAESLLVRQQ